MKYNNTSFVFFLDKKGRKTPEPRLAFHVATYTHVPHLYPRTRDCLSGNPPPPPYTHTHDTTPVYLFRKIPKFE